MSKIYGWLENLNSTVFTLPTNMEDLSQEDEGLPENKETLEKSLEDELEREKEEYKKKCRFSLMFLPPIFLYCYKN